MKKIFLLIDTSDSRIKKSAFEILSHLRETFGNDTSITGYSPDILSKDQIELLNNYSLERLYIPKEPKDINKIEHHKATLISLMKDEDYDFYFGSATDWTNIIMPSIAFIKKCSFYENCTGLSFTGQLCLKKPFYGDKIVADIEEGIPAAASFRQKSFSVIPPEGDRKGVQVIEYDLLMPSLSWIFEGIDEQDDSFGKSMDVKDADIVISVGRGIQDKDKISAVGELIDLFEGRACLGASRVVVDQGWAPFSNQVGQTGKIVAPTLYIALGISGAVQHQVGMNPSKYIIAVNKDPEAPIFEISDYGVVDDLFEFIPAFVEELKRAKC